MKRSSTGRSSSTACSGWRRRPCARSSTSCSAPIAGRRRTSSCTSPIRSRRPGCSERIEGPDKEITFTPRRQERDPQQADRGRRLREILRPQVRRHQALRPGRRRRPRSPRWSRSSSAAAQLGVKEIVLGMAHRGRLNVLANVMAKPYRQSSTNSRAARQSSDEVEGSGDVKYHLGASSDREFDGNKVHLSLTANPSHLEIVNPVVLGKARAKQDQHGATPDDRAIGAAAADFTATRPSPARAWSRNVSPCRALKGFRTGGTIHFIVNNQIGFTTVSALFALLALSLRRRADGAGADLPRQRRRSGSGGVCRQASPPNSARSSTRTW